MRKLLIVGHKGHGKDTAAEYMRDAHGIPYQGSSLLCAPFVHDAMITLGHMYPNDTACYEDRDNHRPFWYQAIRLYNINDKTKVSAAIFDSCSIYAGIRDPEEYAATLLKFDPIVIWIDASNRKPLESAESMKLTYGSPMLYINNNETKENLYKQLDNIANLVLL